MEIATQVVTLIAPYLAAAGTAAATKAGGEAVDAIKSLYTKLRDRFRQNADKYPQETLSRLEERPKDVARQQALAAVLDEMSRDDPEFRQLLVDGLAQATGGRPAHEFVVQVFGQGHVGQVIQADHIDQVNPLAPTKNRVGTSDE
jgi:hypothetical protein